MSAKRAQSSDASRTALGAHTTAAAIGKRYRSDFGASGNPDKRPSRRGDGRRTSAEYIRASAALVDGAAPQALRIEYHHPLERWLGRKSVRRLLDLLTRENQAGRTALERILTSYRNPAAPAWRKLLHAPIHVFIDRMRGRTDAATFRRRLAEHGPTLRGLVLAARSVAEFGLTVPQRFSAPLFAVWNFTNRCNLRCRHCYQDSGPEALEGELTRAEKLHLIDQMGRLHMPMVALSGGEPTVSEDLVPVIRRAKSYDMHVSVATNGTTLTAKRAAELAAAGARYIEISLDSVHPARHDAFRGQPGMWHRSVEGARNVVATEGLRLGIAMCVHAGNVDEVEEMIDFAEELGAGCFAHFNFIPVGRGLRMTDGDISPARREELLALLNERMQSGRIGVISTAPQLGRVCLAGATLTEGRTTCSHAGSGSGVKARVVAKYLGGCGAGRTYVCVQPDGDVTPCVYMPQRVMGNVRRKPLERIFRDSVFWEVLNDRDRRWGHCEVCAFKQYCGGCRARADAYYGALNGPDPGCVLNDLHWEAILDGQQAASAE